MPVKGGRTRAEQLKRRKYAAAQKLGQTLPVSTPEDGQKVRTPEAGQQINTRKGGPGDA